MATDVVTVLCTLPNMENATRVGRAVVEERLAACVNIVPNVNSIYLWQGKLEESTEVLALLKTVRGRAEALRVRLLELHEYDCPEVLELSVEAGHAGYLDWVRENTRPK